MKKRTGLIIAVLALMAFQLWADSLYNFPGSKLIGWNFNEKGDVKKEISEGTDLYIEVNGPFPENEISLGYSIPVKTNTPYIIIISYRMSELAENSGTQETYMVKPGVPSVRLIFADDRNKPVSKADGYIWLKGVFKEETRGNEIVKRIFTTPDKTENLNMRIFFQCRGKFWIEYVKIEELDI